MGSISQPIYKSIDALQSPALHRLLLSIALSPPLEVALLYHRKPYEKKRGLPAGPAAPQYGSKADA